MQSYVFLLIIIFFIVIQFNDVQAQETIIIEETQPCFLEFNSTVQMLRGCGMDSDFLEFSFLGFEWITGGNFTIIMVSLLILFSYVKYQKTAYPLIIGVSMLPISYQFFPVEFVSFAFVMVALVLSILVWHIYIRQTKEYP